MQITGTIYKITSPSGKIYVGQAQDFNKRLNHYQNLDCKSQRILYKSLMKYGYDAHIIEIIDECDISELDNREIKWIADLKTNRYTYPKLKGMNLCDGGKTVRGHKKSPEEIERMRVRATGVKQSAETIAKRVVHLKGRIKSEEEKRKLSLANKGKKLSQEHKDKLKGKREKRPKNLKEFLAQTKLIFDTNTGVFYYGFQDAADHNNIHMSTLVKQLTGKTKRKTTNLILS